MEEKNKIEELLRRVKATARSKYRAAERLEQHHRFAKVSIALLACAVVAIPLLHIFEVSSGHSQRLLDIGQVVLAVFLLVYTLLLIQENSACRAEKMNQDGMGLSNFARKLAGFVNSEVENPEYQSLVNRYYDLLEKSESHKTIDFMFIRLEHRPNNARDWVFYVVNTIKAYLWYFLLFSHYLLAIGVALTALIMIFIGVLSANNVLSN